MGENKQILHNGRYTKARMSAIPPKVAAPREEQNEWSFVGIALDLMKKSRKSEFHLLDGQGVVFIATIRIAVFPMVTALRRELGRHFEGFSRSGVP